MDLGWQYIWWIAGGSVLATTICLLTNNRLVWLLGHTMQYLNEYAKPQLITNNRPTDARFVTTAQLPLLTSWHNEQLNYGLINIIGVICTIVFFVYGALFHKLPYIIISLSALFLGANLLFLPKAITRIFKVIEILTNYILLIKLLESEHKLRDIIDDGKQGST